MKYFLRSFSLPQLSVSDERMCTILVNPLEHLACVSAQHMSHKRIRNKCVTQLYAYVTATYAYECYMSKFTHVQRASVAQLDAPSDWRPGGRGFKPHPPPRPRGRQHFFVEIDHEIFSTVILSLPLIQEGQLSVSGEKMCTILVNRLED